MKVEVVCYSGYKADERPVRFRLDSQEYFVEELLDQWYGPQDVFFKVKANDGAIPAMDAAPSEEKELPPYWDHPTPLHYSDRWFLEGLGPASRSQIKAGLRKVHAEFLEDKAGELPEIHCWRRAYDVFAIQFEEAGLTRF